MKSAVYPTIQAALAACARIDAHLGYPKTEQGEIGPPVVTERFTTPIELIDGTFAVQMTDELRTTTKIAAPIVTRDLATLRKVDPIDATVDPKVETAPAQVKR